MAPVLVALQSIRGVAPVVASTMVVTLVQLTFDFSMIEAKPEKLIGDKAYDRDRLDE